MIRLSESPHLKIINCGVLFFTKCELLKTGYRQTVCYGKQCRCPHPAPLQDLSFIPGLGVNVGLIEEALWMRTQMKAEPVHLGTGNGVDGF